MSVPPGSPWPGSSPCPWQRLPPPQPFQLRTVRNAMLPTCRPAPTPTSTPTTLPTPTGRSRSSTPSSASPPAMRRGISSPSRTPASPALDRCAAGHRRPVGPRPGGSSRRGAVSGRVRLSQLSHPGRHVRGLGQGERPIRRPPSIGASRSLRAPTRHRHRLLQRRAGALVVRRLGHHQSGSLDGRQRLENTDSSCRTRRAR